MISDKEFKTSIDTIVSIIESSISRKQFTNAEKYVNYFFSVIHKCYSKGKFDFDEYNTADSDDYVEIAFRSKYVGFLEYKLFNLLSSVIIPGNYESYDFLRKHYVKVLKDLINKGHKNGAGRLLQRYPLIITNLLTLGNEFSTTERRWFEHSSYTVFESLYVNENINAEDVDTFINGLLYLLKIIVDFNKIEIFDELIHVFMTHYPLTSVGETNLWDIQQQHTLRPEDSLQLLKLNSEPFTYAEYQKIINNYIEALNENDHSELLEKIKEHFLGRYKHNKMRVALFIAVVYSFYKKNFTFIHSYLYAHQPQDSDATWASKDFAFGIYDIQLLLKLKDEIVEHGILSIRHHGFTIYFYQIIAYFLIVASKKDNPFDIIQLNNVTEAENLEHYFTTIRDTLNPSYLMDISNHLEYTRQEFKEVIDKYVNFITTRKNELELNFIKSQKISEEIVDNFADDFLSSFKRNATVRHLIGDNLVLHLDDTPEQNKIIGINKFLFKRIFIPEDGYYNVGISESYGKQEGVRENNALIRLIKEKCETITLSKEGLLDFLNSKKDDFDLIFSYSHDVAEFMPQEFNYKMKYSKEIDQNHKYIGLFDFEGCVLNHYNVFYFKHNLPEHHFLMLSSKNIGTLHQYNVDSIKQGTFKEMFKLSLQDLSQESSEIIEELISDTEMVFDKARLMVIFKMLENIDLRTSEDFIGTYLKIDEGSNNDTQAENG